MTTDAANEQAQMDSAYAEFVSRYPAT